MIEDTPGTTERILAGQRSASSAAASEDVDRRLESDDGLPSLAVIMSA
jgi:hypothetical protein